MKGKKLISILALVVGLSTFGSCTNADQKVNFGNFWNTSVLDLNAAINETLEYNVNFEASTSSLVEYQINYKDGKYTTSLISEKDESGKTVYVYKTQLNITAQYTLNGETAERKDSVTSTVKFFAGEYGLQPIYSEKDVNASSPTASTGATAKECYQQYHYTTKVVYNEDCSAGTSTVTYHPTEGDPKAEENGFEIDKEKFSYLDNEQVLFALRGVRTSTSSAKVLVYSPFVETVQKVSWSFTEEKSDEFSFFKNGSAEKVTSTITYRPVSVVLDEKNPGATQTVWIAKPGDTANNTNRNVMLRLETPLSYGLGSLVYTLNSVSYQ